MENLENIYYPKSLLKILVLNSLTTTLINKIKEIIINDELIILNRIIKKLTENSIKLFYLNKFKKDHYTIEQVWDCFTLHINNLISEVIVKISFIMQDVNIFKKIDNFNNKYDEVLNFKCLDSTNLFFYINIDNFIELIKLKFIFSNNINNEILLELKKYNIIYINIINQIIEIQIYSIIYNFISRNIKNFFDKEIDNSFDITNIYINDVYKINTILVNSFHNEFEDLLLELDKVIINEIDNLFLDKKLTISTE